MNKYVVSFAAGVIVLIASSLVSFREGSGDLIWTLHASRVLLEDNMNPYMVFPIHDLYLDDHLYYPLYTVIFSSIFRIFDISLAGPVFISISSAILAFNLYSREQKLLDVILTFTSINFFSAIYSCQWSVLLYALPILWFLKPSVGIVAFSLIKRTELKIASFLLLIVATSVTTFYWPWWIDSWLYVISHFKNTIHRVPVVEFPAIAITFIFLITRVQSWPLIVSAFVPQSIFFYDQLVYWGLTVTTWEKVFMFLSGWIGIIVLAFTDIDVYTIAAAFTLFPAYLIHSFRLFRERKKFLGYAV